MRLIFNCFSTQSPHFEAIFLDCSGDNYGFTRCKVRELQNSVDGKAWDLNSNQPRMSQCGPNLRIVRTVDKRLECSKDAGLGNTLRTISRSKRQRRSRRGFVHRAIRSHGGQTSLTEDGDSRANSYSGGASLREAITNCAQLRDHCYMF